MHCDASSDPVSSNAMHISVIDLEPEPFERGKPALEEANGVFGPDAEP